MWHDGIIGKIAEKLRTASLAIGDCGGSHTGEISWILSFKFKFQCHLLSILCSSGLTSLWIMGPMFLVGFMDCLNPC